MSSTLDETINSILDISLEKNPSYAVTFAYMGAINHITGEIPEILPEEICWSIVDKVLTASNKKKIEYDCKDTTALLTSLHANKMFYDKMKNTYRLEITPYLKK